MLKFLLTLAISALFAGPSVAACKMPPEAGRYLKSQSRQLYSIQYKGATYSYWDYTGFDSLGKPHNFEVILKNCALAFSGQSGQEISWSIGMPKEVAIAFAKKQVERDIKRLGRNRIQSLLLQAKGYSLQPEMAEGYRALGLRLPQDVQIYPWLVRR